MKFKTKNQSIYNKFVFVMIALVFIILCLSGCSSIPNSITFYDFMGAEATLYVYSYPSNFSHNDFLELKSAIEDELKRESDVFSTEISASEVCAYNALSCGSTLEVSKEFYDVLQTIREINVKTDGLYDPTVKLSVDLWGFSKRHSANSYTPQFVYDRPRGENGGFALPNNEYIQAFSALTDFSGVSNSAKSGKYYITKTTAAVNADGLEYVQQMDLSGYIKGYANERVTELVNNAGITDFWLSFGTSAIFIGKKADANIDLSITDPKARFGTALGVVNLKNKFASTSGTYENCYYINNKKYHHIINPKTGEPVNRDIVLTTLIGNSAAELDALSTAAVVMGRASAIEFLSSNYDEIYYIIVDEDDLVYTNCPDFTLSAEGYTLVRK